MFFHVHIRVRKIKLQKKGFFFCCSWFHENETISWPLDFVDGKRKQKIASWKSHFSFFIFSKNKSLFKNLLLLRISELLRQEWNFITAKNKFFLFFYWILEQIIKKIFIELMNISLSLPSLCAFWWKWKRWKKREIRCKQERIEKVFGSSLKELLWKIDKPRLVFHLRSSSCAKKINFSNFSFEYFIAMTEILSLLHVTVFFFLKNEWNVLLCPQCLNQTSQKSL